MLKRKIESKILSWIKNGSNALLIEGARQVGKTFIIRESLRKEGCDYIEFNLIEFPQIVKLLETSQTVDEMIVNLSLFTDKQFKRNKTIIFFDEIQEFKELATKIKFWVEEGSFKYILSGSLLGVELKNIKSAPVGYLTTLTMYPLDFEEFLQVYNFTDDIKISLKKSYIERTPVNEIVHEQLMKMFNMYLNVGGMPSAVNVFKDTKNLDEVMRIHQDIINQYKLDYTRYEEENKKLLLNEIYTRIPAELNSSNKRFNFADLKKGIHFERIENNFLWLSSAGVALPVYNVTEPLIPLLINQKRSLFKLFLSDVGLLTTQYGKNAKIKILSGESSFNYGSIYENVVAQELKAHGFDLNYYNSKKYGELDFVIEYKDNVLPLEIKSGKDYTRYSALKNVMSIRNYSIKECFILNNHNVKVNGNFIYYPIYMIMFIVDDNDLFSSIKSEDLSF